MRNIPVLFVKGGSLAQAYENALRTLWLNGFYIKTEYDKEEDLNSVDSTMNITVKYPESEPMIHKAFPGGIEDLREYVMELEGAKDHWTKNMNDPDDTRWEYTYHRRFAKWGEWKEKQEKTGTSYDVGYCPSPVNQIKTVINKLFENPHTRRAQMITWMPFMDNDIYDPPCIQSLWYRITENHNGSMKYLNCNVRIRSNDAWNASFMNMFGVVQFNRDVIINGLKEKGVENLDMGRLNWQADSYHVYGKDRERFDQFYGKLFHTNFNDRTYIFSDPLIQEIWNESEEKIIEKIRKYDETH